MQNSRVPSKSVLSRMRFLVDAAFMCYMRELHARSFVEANARPVEVPGAGPFEDAAAFEDMNRFLNAASFRYLRTDASPQGGR
eukprot:2425787-Alexandrium_andersonii.AAC.1